MLKVLDLLCLLYKVKRLNQTYKVFSQKLMNLEKLQEIKEKNSMMLNSTRNDWKNMKIFS